MAHSNLQRNEKLTQAQGVKEFCVEVRFNQGSELVTCRETVCDASSLQLAVQLRYLLTSFGARGC